MAFRAVLPADEADAQDHEIRRTVGERGAHPDRRGADRLSSVARPATEHQRNAPLPRARSTRARQSHASKRRRSTPKSPASRAARLTPAPTLLPFIINRTAVGQARPWRRGSEAQPQKARPTGIAISVAFFDRLRNIRYLFLL